MTLAGERRAITAAVFGTFFLYHLAGVFMGLPTGAEGLVLYALAGAYGLAFLAVVAGYRLARPIGFTVLALGVVRGVLDLDGGGIDEATIMYFGMHAAGVLGLVGAGDLPYLRIVGERRAVATIIIAFYALIYVVMGYLQGPPFGKALMAVGGVYVAAFFALVAGYFWARWFAVGVALFGVIQGAIGLWQMGPEPVVVFLGGTHLLATLALWGNAMATPYDGQTAWREKFHMDDNAVQRLGRSVIRAGVSLPMVLLYALAPKPEPTAIVALVLAVGGIAALLRLRTWGVLAMGAAGVMLLAQGGQEAVGEGWFDAAPILGGAFLLAATAPFVRAMRAMLQPPC
jgi:hypothetical protein